MSSKEPKSCVRSRLAAFVACLLILSAGSGLAQSPPAPQKPTDLQADCRIEGEAGGLSGTDLDQFIEECVADLMAVEFSNNEK